MTKLISIRHLQSFFCDECGATAIEYALIASGIAAAIIVTVGTLGTHVKSAWTSVSNALN